MSFDSAKKSEKSPTNEMKNTKEWSSMIVMTGTGMIGTINTMNVMNTMSAMNVRNVKSAVEDHKEPKG